MFNIVYFENSCFLEYHTAESEGFYTLPNSHFLHFGAWFWYLASCPVTGAQVFHSVVSLCSGF